MKTYLHFSFVLFIFSAFLISGCASSGMNASTNVTQVQLNQANYKLIACNVKGEAKAKYLLGASFGIGAYAQTFALIPLTKERALYKQAIENLWKNFEGLYGSPVGRRLALVNFRYDSETLNLLVYTSPKVTLVADVVEFTE